MITHSLIAQAQLPKYEVPLPNAGASTMFDTLKTLFDPSNPDVSLGKLVSRLIMFAIIVAGLIFFVQIISAGFSFLTSAGDSAKIQSATKNLLTAVIGLLVVISAFFLAQIIQFVFGVQIL